ncbi:MAG: heavy metal-associated domain-containing protein [Chloroflexota bacterium]
MTIKTAVLEVIGDQPIHCSSCESAIRRALRQLPGVRRVEPSQRTQRIELTLDTEQTSLATIRERLDWMGWQTQSPTEP